MKLSRRCLKHTINMIATTTFQFQVSPRLAGIYRAHRLGLAEESLCSFYPMFKFQPQKGKVRYGSRSRVQFCLFMDTWNFSFEPHVDHLEIRCLTETYYYCYFVVLLQRWGRYRIQKTSKNHSQVKFGSSTKRYNYLYMESP